jgi:hypothetical protein
MKNKHIEQSSWEENMEHYPAKTDWLVILLAIAVPMFIAWVVIEFIIGADNLIGMFE